MDSSVFSSTLMVHTHSPHHFVKSCITQPYQLFALLITSKQYIYQVHNTFIHWGGPIMMLTASTCGIREWHDLMTDLYLTLPVIQLMVEMYTFTSTLTIWMYRHSIFAYLAWFLIHIEAGKVGVSHLLTHFVDDIMGQFDSQVRFPCATGSGEDDPAVLRQQVQVALHYWFWDQGIKHQFIYAALPDTYTQMKRIVYVFPLLQLSSISQVSFDV